MKSYNFVGYGSLISHGSLKGTIKDKEFVPVVVKGYQRVFNVLARNNTDFLNIEKKKESRFNGVLFKVNKDELKKIKEREQPEYKFTRSWAYDFKDGRKIALASLVVDHRISIDKTKKMPNRLYFLSCRKAAYSISKRFGKMWDGTTYTSSGEKISEWVKKNKSYDRLKN